MSFSADGFCRKLEALQETQDSIVKLSQWVLFHHRHLPEIARLWATTVEKQPRGSSRKQLTLLYLCNDVVQQAKRKRKQEFVDEFAQVLPSVLQRVFAQLDSATQGKVERLISVWQDRVVFDSAQIDTFRRAVKQSVQAQPSAAAGPVAGASGGSGDKSTVVPELNHLNDLFSHLNKVNATAQGNLTQFGVQSKQYLPDGDSDTLPSPKVYLSKLNTLEKLGEMATANVKEQQRLKHQIKHQLATMLSTLEEGVAKDDEKIAIIASKLTKLNSTRDELKQLVNDEASHHHQSSPSATKEKAKPVAASPPVEVEEEDEGVPTYEKDSDDDDDDDDDNDVNNKSGATVKAKANDHADATADADGNDNNHDAASADDGVLVPTGGGAESEGAESSGDPAAPLSPGGAGASDADGENGSRKRRLSQTPSGGSTPAYKKVAFSEDIEVKEFDQDDGNSDDHADAPDDDDTAAGGSGAGADIMSLLMKLN